MNIHQQQLERWRRADRRRRHLRRWLPLLLPATGILAAWLIGGHLGR